MGASPAEALIAVNAISTRSLNWRLEPARKSKKCKFSDREVQKTAGSPQSAPPSVREGSRPPGMRAPARIRAAIILLALVSRVTGSTPAGPSACPFRDDGTSLDLVLSSTLAHEAHAPVPSRFRVLSEVVDAARAVCGDDTFLFYAAAGGQTMFAPTDQAFEELFIELDRGLEEVLGNPTFLCGLIRYHLTVPCTAVNNALFGRSCGFLLTNDMVDAQPLETLFNDQALSAGLELTGAGSASSLLFVAISQAVTARKVRVDGYMKRGADVIVPNVVLCDTLAVHVVDTVLSPGGGVLFVDRVGHSVAAGTVDNRRGVFSNQAAEGQLPRSGPAAGSANADTDDDDARRRRRRRRDLRGDCSSSLSSATSSSSRR